MHKVAVIMGSKNDFDSVKPAIDVLAEFGIKTEVRVLSAHRTPHEASDFASSAREKGFSVIIAAAGKAAHLAGVIAGHTTLPVIGIPIKSSFLDGLDSLLSTVQMPSGVPVATVAVDGALNAGLLATQIIGVTDTKVSEQLTKYKKEMTKSVLASDKNLQESK